MVLSTVSHLLQSMRTLSLSEPAWPRHTSLSSEHLLVASYYFVHGLGGHAFETFAAPIQKKHKHKEQKMWARDLLPEKFAKAGLQGRFSTLGYNANIVGGAGTTTIESAAKDLLYQLQHDRPEGSQRPIFFVAHSLGGLVVAQVLRNAKSPFPT